MIEASPSQHNLFKQLINFATFVEAIISSIEDIVLFVCNHVNGSSRS